MSHKYAEELIQTLTRRFRAECPECGEPFPLARAGLFYLDHFTPAARALYDEHRAELTEQRREIRALPEQIVEESDGCAEAVNLGSILERLAPSLDSFPFRPSECRSLFDPIDYLAFRGLARSSVVEEIAFIEIKSGRARLNGKQKTIREVVEAGKVTFEVYECED